MTEPIITIEESMATVRMRGKEVQVPMKTETIKYEDGRQDIKIHLPVLSTIATMDK